jgi:concanavalin A-like lectin/glucanase superfamily protein
MAFKTAHPVSTEPAFQRRFSSRWAFSGRARVFDPELEGGVPSAGQELRPDTFTVPAAVFAPTIAHAGELEPSPWTEPAATVHEPELASAARPYAEAVLADGPIRWWRLDETAGTVAVDATGNADGAYVNTPTLGVPALIDEPGTAVQTTASQAEDITGPIPALSASDFSLEFWIRWTAGVAPVRDDSTGGGTGTIPLLGDGSTLAFRSTGNEIDTSITTASVRNGQRHHVVLTRAGTTATLYVDGVEVGTGTDPSGGLATPLHFGRNGQFSQYADAIFDECAVYDHALSAERVAAHHGAGRHRPVRPAFWTEPEPVVHPPTLPLDVPGQPMHPEPIVVEAGDVEPPALGLGEPLVPQPWAEPEPTVAAPTLIPPQRLDPASWTEPAPSMFAPALIPGQFLDPASWTEPATAVVHSPTLIPGQAITPEPFTGEPATVFAPALAPGQVLRPPRIELTIVVPAPKLIRAELALRPTRIEPTAVVHNPELRHGQVLRPTRITLTTTVHTPRLHHAQPLRPGSLTGPPATVHDPRLIPGQFLRPDSLPAGLLFAVHDPRLAHAQPLHPATIAPPPPATVYDPALEFTPDRPPIVVAGMSASAVSG